MNIENEAGQGSDMPEELASQKTFDQVENLEEILTEAPPDNPTGTGAEIKTGTDKDAKVLGEEGAVIVADEDLPDADKKTEKKEVKEDKKEETKETKEEPEDDGEKAKKAEEAEEAEEDDSEFEYPEIEDKKEADKPTDADADDEEPSWITTARELELEDVDSDDFDQFKGAYQKKLEKVKAEALAEITKKYENPETKRAIEFLEAGGDFEQLREPLRVYDEVLSLDAEGIIGKDLELKNWDPARIAEHIEILREENKLDATAYALRKSVEGYRQQAAEKLYNDKIESKKALQESIKQERIKEDKLIETEVDRVSKFLGGKLPDSVKAKIKNEWKNGTYRKRMAEDPKFVVNAILYSELGEAAVTELTKNRYQEGKDTLKKKLHNIEDAKRASEAGGKLVGARKQEETESPFSNWVEGVKDGGISGVEHQSR